MNDSESQLWQAVFMHAYQIRLNTENAKNDADAALAAYRAAGKEG